MKQFFFFYYFNAWSSNAFLSLFFAINIFARACNKNFELFIKVSNPPQSTLIQASFLFKKKKKKKWGGLALLKIILKSGCVGLNPRENVDGLTRPRTLTANEVVLVQHYFILELENTSSLEKTNPVKPKHAQKMQMLLIFYNIIHFK